MSTRRVLVELLPNTSLTRLRFAPLDSDRFNFAMVYKVLVFGASERMMPCVIPHIVKKFDLQITAFVLPARRACQVRKRSASPSSKGRSWTDEELIMRTIKDFDVVWDAGDSHDPSLPKLLVPLLEQSVSNPTLFRFSGTGNWVTQTGGVASAAAKKYNDLSAEDIASLHVEMSNGAGDIIALEALNKGVNVWLLCAGGVYGVPSAGIPAPSVFVRLYTNNALSLGYAPYIGDGSAHMQLIHIDDGVSATDIFLQYVLPNWKPVQECIAPHNRFFNARSYSYIWKHIAET